ncbi:Endo-chitosanase [Penicillium diatomitis]|uniref:Endo-chitosanase n=1 Tax=Penicillium diatomitis TaxID=2819901 RepID=A0A9W9WL94_9EURO|nr:Endo-chitosanase [Penicillium diatomitis]KAJ5469233.1 Endo-chitosanase [Penicillium diatomitis]
MNILVLTAVFSAGIASTYDIPKNLQQIYNNHKNGKCNNKLAGGFTDGIGGATTFAYCGDINGAIFLHSLGNGGQYDNMDVDCDGANNYGGDCANDPSGQSQTAFMDSLPQYGIQDLNANVHPVMAVVCNNQLLYGIWGDTNGYDSTGEVSIALAQMCYPNDGLTGDNGHGPDDVLYIGFTGSGAVPGGSADWQAGDRWTFEASIKDLGDRLVAGLQA